MSLAAYPDFLPSLQALLGDDAPALESGLLDLLPVGVYVCDRDGRLIDYNKAAADLWGRAPRRGDDALRYCGSFRLHSLDGEVIPHDACPMADVLATGEARRDQEIVIERYDGSRLTALVSIEPIKDIEGRTVGAINVFRDHSAQHAERKHLRRQRRKLSSMLQAMPAAVYTTDAAGRITFFNDAAAELWGVRPALGTDQFCGSWKLYRPDGSPLPHEECPMALALKSGTAIEGMEAVLERPDGTRTPFLAFPTPLFDPSGAITGAVNVLLNLAERHEIHERLRSSEARFRALFDNAQVSVWEADFSEVVAFLDGLRAGGIEDLRAHLLARPDCLRQAIERLHITGVNTYTLELFEADDEGDLLGAPQKVLLPETEGAVIDQFVALWNGERRWAGETALRSLSGRRIDAMVTLAFEGERAERSVITAQDITERKATEMAAQRLAAIVESSGDAIVSKDLNGIITSWNKGAERLFGYTAEEAVGQPVIMLIPADRQDEEEMILSRVRSGRRVDHYETIRQRKDGTQLNISLTVSPIRAPDGTIVGASKIARDITERAEAQQQQQLLLREMNHRIKNLLTLSSGLVSLSARYAETPAELAGAVQERLGALARAQEMVVPSTAGDAERSTTLRALIKTIVSPYDTPQGSGPSRIEINGCDTEIAGRAVTGFALLLHELATNAAKYGGLSTETGRVEIDCQEDGDTLVIGWRERGGPPVDPAREGSGFGSVLSRATVQSQLRGTLTREWHPDGLFVRLTAPKARLLS